MCLNVEERVAMNTNFIRMSVWFSINHASVTSVLGLAVGLLGKAGTYQSGSLFLVYAITAMVFSTMLIDAVGARAAIIYASALYCFYVFSFPLALIVPPSQTALQTLVGLFGGVLGGVAAGILWPAQGVYFALSAKQYAADNDIDISQANTTLATTFAGIYLIIEVIFYRHSLTITTLPHMLCTSLHALGRREAASAPPYSGGREIRPLGRKCRRQRREWERRRFLRIC